MPIRILFILAVAVLWSCTGSPEQQQRAQEGAQSNLLPDTTQSVHLTGQQLAQGYCRSCHAFPDPSLLDKKTWENGVLPQMAQRMGVGGAGMEVYMNKSQEEVGELMQANIFPQQPMIARRDWAKIVAYYLQNAPAQLAQPTVAAPTPTLVNFAVVVPALHKGQAPLTTMLKYEAEAKALWVGSLRNQLFKLNGQLQITDSVKTASAPVDLLSSSGSQMVLTIGSMNPSDAKLGAIYSFSAGQAAQAPVQLLNKLRRPVSMVSGDLDRDGREDLVVCQYGNNIGSLVWYRNLGAGKYEPRVLANVPGARKAELADLDGDGRQDVVAMFAQATESVKVFYNKGRNRFEEKTLLQFPPVYGLSYFELADFNHDGAPDIVLTTGDNADFSPVLKPYHGVRVFLNNGRSKFEEKYFYPLPGASKAIARDFDQDGDVDIAAISFFPDFKAAPARSFVYLQQEKNFDFEASTFAQAGNGHWLTLEAGDYDQDGDTDLFLGSFVYTPAPAALQEKWVKDGPGILVLQNKTLKSIALH